MFIDYIQIQELLFILTINAWTPHWWLMSIRHICLCSCHKRLKTIHELKTSTIPKIHPADSICHSLNKIEKWKNKSMNHNIIVDIINVILSKFRMQNLQALFAELAHLAIAGRRSTSTAGGWHLRSKRSSTPMACCRDWDIELSKRLDCICQEQQDWSANLIEAIELAEHVGKRSMSSVNGWWMIKSRSYPDRAELGMAGTRWA